MFFRENCIQFDFLYAKVLLKFSWVAIFIKQKYWVARLPNLRNTTLEYRTSFHSYIYRKKLILWLFVSVF